MNTTRKNKSRDKYNNGKGSYKKISFSQSGEDLIVKFIFDNLKIPTPTYIDIGAHHPRYINNTAIFYDTNSSGINIEPDPQLFMLFQEDRERDVNLNIGISVKQATLDFYILSTRTLSTFSKEEVKKYEKEGFYVSNVIKVKTKKINDTIATYMGKAPDFINLDAEGVNFEILKSLNFRKYGPKVICVETISFSLAGKGVKNNKIIRYLGGKGYLQYADTYINSIFVKKSLWVR